MTTVHFRAVDTESCGPLLSGKTFLCLIQGIKTWSKSRGAKRILLHVTSSVDLNATDRLIRAAGGVIIGGGYVV